MEDTIIRFAVSTDFDQLIALCHMHARFERTTISRNADMRALFTCIFGPEAFLKCLVVVNRDELIGYATFIKQFSTWEAGFYLYVDCLYLKKEARGRRLGKMVMQQIKHYAQSEHCRWIQWQTPVFNESAIAFYNKLGAISKKKERFFWNVSSAYD